MSGQQLSILDVESENCPFKNLRDSWDTHCFSMGDHLNGYDYLSEDQPKRLVDWLASINGVDFSDISVSQQLISPLPTYVPRVVIGARKLIHPNVTHYAITLDNACSKHTNKIAPNIKDRLEITSDVKLILLCYGHDQLIENIWGNREAFYQSISDAQIDYVTGINYSIWFSQPHAERLINIKRGLITFAEMQYRGFSAIPHIYWSGHRDLERWAEWINGETNLSTVAINLQTMKPSESWNSGFSDLTYFSGLLRRNIQFLISGPSTPQRISQLRSIFNQVCITNGVAAAKANASHIGAKVGSVIKWTYSNQEKPVLFNKNVKLFNLL